LTTWNASPSHHRALSQPIALQTHNPVVTPSIGIAMYPQDGEDADSLVRNADTAMYAAKADGRACFRFYNEEMNARSIEQLKLEEDLREALRKISWSCVTSPRSRYSPGALSVLRRWCAGSTPSAAWCLREIFIPVAERTGADHRGR
jgi:predicted signal transduction protein with EAL and GGDEF domain